MCTVVAALLAAGLAGSVACSAADDDDLIPINRAKQYVLDLINRDRASVGLGPVRIDNIAGLAAQRHAEECSANGYMAHWDLLGRKPWERYTDAGGRASVAENVAYTGTFREDVKRPETLSLPKEQLFSKHDLSELESAMYNERPPGDGHRKNILNPDHTGVGIGLALGISVGESRVTMDQEFTDDYGNFARLPRTLPSKQPIVVEGTLEPGVKVYNILLDWEPTPRAMTPKQLNTTHSYGWPETTLASFAPAGYASPVPIVVSNTPKGQHFSLSIPALRHPAPGVYYVIVWAMKSGTKDAFVASVQTLSYGPRASLPATMLASKKPTVEPAQTKNDIRNLFFHPELVGSKVVPATAGGGGSGPSGPPDPSALFFKLDGSRSSDATSNGKAAKSAPQTDLRELFFTPQKQPAPPANSASSSSSSSSKKSTSNPGKPDPRELFYHP